MRHVLIITIGLLIYSFSFSQTFEGIEDISPFYDDLAAIKKGNQWAFINKENVKVIDFRDDLVPTKTKSHLGIYPIFIEGKCLIKKKIDGVYHYGFINKSGKEIIKPQYLNATNFNNGYALVIEYLKETRGTNSVLGKRVISTKLEEYIIDAKGNKVKYLDNVREYIPSKNKTDKPPIFYSKFVAPNLIAVKTKDSKWNIYKF